LKHIWNDIFFTTFFFYSSGCSQGEANGIIGSFHPIVRGAGSKWGLQQSYCQC